MTNLVIDEKTICDLECIIDGYFNPLNTFMNKKDWESVCENLHLSNGLFFPLPVTLAIEKNFTKEGETIILVDSTNYPLAELNIEEIYEPDINWECLNSYGTNDNNHPYVKYKENHKGKMYVSGKLNKINNIRHYDFQDHRIKPLDSKKYFKEKEWSTIVGFQTRNPMHRAHYELTNYALSKTNDENAKLFLNPVVGETQSVDIDYHIRVQCYKKILPKYEKNKVCLGLLPLAMRMAGPREACLHAVIRKNYGCTHFVVGRDHAGPSFKTKNNESFYDPYEAQILFFKHAEEIGIIPIVSKMIVYNETKNIYQPIDEISKDQNVLKLSGTELRKKLRNREEIPEWFSYPEVVSLLQSSIKSRGTCYYLVGLSGSGKTTYANKLKSQILEKYPEKEVTILDGDTVRHNLTKELGFSKKDRSTNVRRIGYVASEIVKYNGIVICANIAPYDIDRLHNRNLIESLGGKYIEVWINTDLETCEKRDVKGLYKLAREGVIKQFTGISDPFDKPSKYDIEITTEDFDFKNLI